MDSSLKAVKLVLVCTVLLTCSACGYLFGDRGVFRDKSEDYKQAPEVPVLALPAGRNGSDLPEIYPIPPIADDIVLAGKFEVPRPTPLIAGAADELVKIQKLGDDSWALISAAPGQVWPQVRSFLSAAQVPVGRIDARGGIIESGWLELEEATMSSRFRFRIEQGVQRGTSELHVLQMNQAGDPDTWPATSDNEVQENDMLLAVAQFIANSADSTPVSMVADQAINATGKISMQEDSGGHAFIQLGLPYDRAWASVGRALEESRFEIADRDRSAGKYYVRFLGAQSDEDKGWFGWMLGGDDEDPLAGRQFVVKVDSLEAGDVAIRIQPHETASGNEPAAVNKRDEQALLTLLKGNID